MHANLMAEQNGESQKKLNQKRKRNKLASTEANECVNEYVKNIFRYEEIEIGTRECDRMKFITAYQNKLQNILLQEMERNSHLVMVSDENQISVSDNRDQISVSDDQNHPFKIKQMLERVPFNRIRRRWKLLHPKHANLVDCHFAYRFLDFMCAQGTNDNFLVAWEYAIELSYLLRLCAWSHDLNQETVVPIRNQPCMLCTRIGSHLEKPMVILAVLLAGRHLTIDWTTKVPTAVPAYVSMWSYIQRTKNHWKEHWPSVAKHLISLLGERFAVHLWFYSTQSDTGGATLFHIFEHNDHSDFLYGESVLLPDEAEWARKVNQRRINYRNNVKTILLNHSYLNGIRDLEMIVISFLGKPSRTGLVTEDF